MKGKAEKLEMGENRVDPSIILKSNKITLDYNDNEFKAFRRRRTLFCDIVEPFLYFLFM